MMPITKWLNRAWNWVRNKEVLFPVNHHNNTTRSEVKDTVCRSDSKTFEDVDQIPRELTRIPSYENAVQTEPTDSRTSDAIRLKNPYCIVIVNIFYGNRAGARNGAQADLENIERLLRHSAGFQTVYVYVDLTRESILKIMDHVSNSSEVGEHDGLVVFISSHGKARGILAVDKEIVKMDELISRVNGRQCKSLRGKPKLFFISACRGKKTDHGVPTETIVSDAHGDEKLVPRLPTDTDFLICYSTTWNHASFRRWGMGIQNHPEMGTWLISSITKVFEEKMKEEDIMHMLTSVNARVASMASCGDDVSGMKQMPVQMHMLRHQVFFGQD